MLDVVIANELPNRRFLTWTASERKGVAYLMSVIDFESNSSPH
jgi:hypothetical protein